MNTSDDVGYGPHATGKAAEATAIAWLSRRKYECFTAWGSHSLCDLVAVKRRGVVAASVTLIEVRATDYAGKNHRRLSADQVKAGVELLLVYPDGNCAWAKSDQAGETDE